jgi:hypothetical protein
MRGSNISARDRHPLSLPARKLMRIAVAMLGPEPDLPQSRWDAAIGLA